MIYTCPKCGKKMDLSTEVLINSEYNVVCPQCLCQLQIVGDYAYIPNDELQLDTSVEPSHTITCPNCGHETNSNTHFCPNCGNSFDKQATPPASGDTDVEDATVLPPPIPNGDPLYNEAVKFLMTCTSVTPMMLMERFHISQERAAELIRQLEAGGVIGPYNNGGPRQILIPHRSLYGSMRQFAPKNGYPIDPTPQSPRRMGCLPMLFIFFFIIILMKACGM